MARKAPTGNRIFQYAGRGGTFLQVLGTYGNAKAAVDSNTIRGRGPGTGLDHQRGSAQSLEVTSNGNLVSDVEVDRQVGEGVTIGGAPPRSALTGVRPSSHPRPVTPAHRSGSGQ